MDPLEEENIRCEEAVKKYAKYYRALENKAPADFKILMLVNGWQSPFQALEELVNRVYSNEMIMKRNKVKFKRRYRDLNFYLQEFGRNKVYSDERKEMPNERKRVRKVQTALF